MKVSKQTIARTICLVIVLINQAMAILGKNELTITNDQVYQLVSLVFTITASLRCWWKNNSFTQSALIADAKMFEEKGLKLIANGLKDNIAREEEYASTKEAE